MGWAKRPGAYASQRGRKPSGQPGHRGNTLPLVDTPDLVVDYSPSGQCRSCGAALEEVPLRGYERRQVRDLPEIKPEVVEHRAQSKGCPCCHQVNKGEIPSGVSHTVQYGERLKGLGVYLLKYQLLPYERTREVFEDVFGASLSEESLYESVKGCYQGLEQTEEAIKEEYQQGWAGKMKGLLVEIKGQVEEQKAQGAIRLLEEGSLRELERQYQETIEEGLLENPPPEVRLGQRGRKKQSKAKDLLDRLSSKGGGSAGFHV